MTFFTSITRSVLSDAVRRANSSSDVLRLLGTYDDGPNRRRLTAKMHEFGIAPHWKVDRDEKLAAAVASSRTMTEVIQSLGLSLSPNNFRRLKLRAHALGIDTSHLGRRVRTSERHGCKRRERISLTALLVEGSLVGSSTLRRRLLDEGILDAVCNWPDCPTRNMMEWRGGLVHFELDHINGDGSDNRLSNLRLLCRMCHAQTATFSRRKNSPGKRR